MRVFLCSIDDTVWDAIEAGWTRPEAAKSTWDKVAFAAANANSKALKIGRASCRERVCNWV